MDAKQRSASVLRLLGRFRLGSLLWLCLLAAILLMWHRDHAQLQLQIAKHSGVNRTAWSIDQILGQPDTTGFGDIATAWAPQNRDAGTEWVIVEFPSTVKATGVDVYETFNPGAVVRVASVSMSGAEQIVWEGTDPVWLTPPSPAALYSGASTFTVNGFTVALPVSARGGIPKIKFPAPVSTRRLKLYIDSAAVPGWNEIDADVAAELEEGWDALCRSWDRMYPSNPVPSEKDEDDDGRNAGEEGKRRR